MIYRGIGENHSRIAVTQFATMIHTDNVYTLRIAQLRDQIIFESVWTRFESK